MTTSIQQGNISGVIIAPASKSHFIRCVFCALFAEGTTSIHNPSMADDSLIALEIIRTIGAKYHINNDLVIIESPGFSKLNKSKLININVGESGLCLRISIALANIFDEILIHMADNLSVRIDDEFLCTHINPEISYKYRYCILHLRKMSEAKSIIIESSISSQFLTGLLMALPNSDGDRTIQVDSLASKYYIDLTIDTLKSFNINIIHKNYSKFIIHGNQLYKPVSLTTEGCYSSAVFFMVAGAIGGEVRIGGLRKDSKQADAQILNNLFTYTYENSDLIIKKQEIPSFDIDITHFPDLAPALVVLALNSQDKCTIKGAKRLINKESNRAQALYEEFTKIGGKIELTENEIIVYPSKLYGGFVNSHHDHRIAMALSIAALNAESAIHIENSECVSKSYPNFFKDLESLR